MIVILLLAVILVGNISTKKPGSIITSDEQEEMSTTRLRNLYDSRDDDFIDKLDSLGNGILEKRSSRGGKVTTDIALHKPVTCAELRSDKGYYCSDVTDGNIKKRGGLITKRQIKPWLQIDLGASYRILKVVNYRYFKTGRAILGSLITTIDDNKIYQCGVITRSDYTPIGGWNGKDVVRCAGKVYGRFVKVELQKKGILRSKEIEVYGYLAQPPPARAVSLVCSTGQMTATFDEKLFPQQILHISIVGCDSFVVNKNSVSTNFKDCAKNITEGHDVITQENVVAVVTGSRESGKKIHRITVYYFKLECKFNRRLNVTLGAVNVVDRKESFKEIKTTNFVAKMSAYRTSEFSVLAPTPLKVTAGDAIFMQIVGSRPNHNLKFITQDCFATPSANPMDRERYMFFYNKCPLDETFKEYNPNTNNTFSFSINAFTFIKLNKMVYFHCSLLICRTTSETEECTQRCKTESQKRESVADNRNIEMITVNSGAIQWEKKRTLDAQFHDVADDTKKVLENVDRLDGEISDFIDELENF